MWTTSFVQGRLDIFSDMMSLWHHRNDITEMTSLWGHYDINGLSHRQDRLVYKGVRPTVEDFLFSFLLRLSEKQLQRRLPSIYWVDQWTYFTSFVIYLVFSPIDFVYSSRTLFASQYLERLWDIAAPFTPAKFPSPLIHRWISRRYSKVFGQAYIFFTLASIAFNHGVRLITSHRSGTPLQHQKVTSTRY